MSNYTKTTNFATKDALASGNPAKIVKGTEIDTEFNNIAVASGTKADKASPTFTGTVTLPVTNADSLSIGGDGVTVTGIKDEDDMASNSATKLASQQSIKAYVDAQVTAQDLDVTDGTTSISIDLDSEALSILGGTGVTSTAAGNGVTLAIDSTVATLTGTQTLTNKTLTSPDVNTPDIDGGTIDGTVIGGTTAAAGSFTTVDATGNIIVGGTIDGRDVAADGTKLDGIESGATADQTAAEIKTAYESNEDTNAFTDADESKLDGIEALADVTDTANVTAAGALMDSELTSIASVKALDQGVATTDSPTFAALTSTGEITANGGIALGDNDKATFGAGDDLQIFHDGGNSRIYDQGTGALVVRSNQLNIQSPTGEKLALFNQDSDVELYYDDSLKLSTTATGIGVTGNASFADNGKATFGAGDDLQIYHDGSNSYIDDVGTGNLLINADSLRLRDTTGSPYLLGNVGAEVRLYHAGSTKLATTATGIDVTGTATMDGLTVNGDINGPATNNLAIRSKYSATIDIDSDNNQTDRNFQVIHDGSKLLLKAEESGDISFYEDTGTTPKLFWDASAESLGIGVSSVNARLEVAAFATTSSDIAHFSNSNGASKALIRLDAQGDGEFVLRDASNNEDVVINAGGDSYFNGGNVGIGTSSPATQVELSSTASAVLRLSTSDTAVAENQEIGALEYYQADASGAGAGVKASIRAKSDNDTAAQTYLAFHTSSSSANDNESMRIDSSGNLLLNTLSSPTTTKAIISADYSAAGTTNTGLTIAGRQGGNWWNNGIHALGASGLVFSTGTSGTNGADATNERMRIDAGGSLLVGGTSKTSVPSLDNGVYLQSQTDGDVLGYSLYSNEGTNNRRAAFFLDDTNGVYGFDASASSGVPEFVIRRAGSEAMRIDASGNVGIGTSSPTSVLDVRASGVSTPSTLSLVGTNSTSSDSCISQIKSSESSAGSGSSELSFHTRAVGGAFATPAERMRIDSSGGLLVGKTASALATAGHQFFPTGSQWSTVSNARVLLLNRLSSDGDIAEFRKDGTAVGSIGTVSGDFNIFASASGHKGLRLGAGFIAPTSNSTSIEDATTDLGISTAKFRNLYLSGGVYLGGTGDANKLDDYEEGTWTPTLEGDTSGSAPLTVTSASYTKIGNTVHAYCYLSAIDLSADDIVGNMVIKGLPFNVSTNNLQSVAITYQALSATYLNMSGRLSSGFIRLQQDASNFSLARTDCVTTSGKVIMVGCTYPTNA